MALVAPTVASRTDRIEGARRLPWAVQLESARAAQLGQLIAERRSLMWFRLGVAAAIVLFYQNLLGLVPTLIWAGGYCALQLIEAMAFRPQARERRVSTRGGAMVAFALMSANTVVFCILSVLWPLTSGPWGVSNGAFLLCGAMLTVVQTTQRSRTAFLVSVAPITAYSLTVPVVALWIGCGWAAGSGLVIGAIMLNICAVKVWQEAHGAFLAERAARADAERRRAEAESAVAAKSAFVAMVSHELRTPISAILAGAAELERQNAGANAAHARLIADAGAMMRTLLNDLLDFAKLDAGHMSVEATAFDYRGLIADQLRFWRAEASKKGIRLRLQGARKAPRWVEGDPTRLRQILNNLMSNALKFTERGSVTVALSTCRQSNGCFCLCIAVRDTGQGMTAEQLSRLFTPFSQGDASVARTHGGTGLGLSISRQLARLMGGDITVESIAGEGSCFSVSITVAPATPMDAAPDARTSLDRTASILVVDDHEVNRRALSLMLEPLGTETVVAPSGPDALSLLAERPFDVVLMDVHMPGMSGLEATRRLRQSVGPNRATPVIAVTGATEDQDIRACREAGMSDWVAKPVDAGQLYAALARQLEPAISSEAAA